jgi:hypothetical protein
MQDLEKRVTKVEFAIDAHADQLAELHAVSKELHTTLSGIQATLMQIKWIAIGALLVVLISDSALGAQLLKMLA